MRPTQLDATGKVALNGNCLKANNLPRDMPSTESYRTGIILRLPLNVRDDVTREDSGRRGRQVKHNLPEYQLQLKTELPRRVSHKLNTEVRNLQRNELIPRLGPETDIWCSISTEVALEEDFFQKNNSFHYSVKYICIT
jgi:hypothetical protein